MPVEVYVADIKSNTDKLSAMAVHDTLVDFVRNEALMGEVALKAIVPKREGDMAKAASHKGPHSEGPEIEASVGIPEIHKPDESSPYSAKYPIFVDKGTGIFGDEEHPIFPKDKTFMYIPESRGYPGFIRESKGQKGKEFMAATFSVMIAMLRINGERFKADLIAKMKSDTSI